MYRVTGVEPGRNRSPFSEPTRPVHSGHHATVGPGAHHTPDALVAGGEVLRPVVEAGVSPSARREATTGSASLVEEHDRVALVE